MLEVDNSDGCTSGMCAWSIIKNVPSFHWSQFVFLFYPLKPEGPQDRSGALGETVSCPIFPEPLNVILHGRTDRRDEGL